MSNINLLPNHCNLAVFPEKFSIPGKACLRKKQFAGNCLESFVHESENIFTVVEHCFTVGDAAVSVYLTRYWMCTPGPLLTVAFIAEI